MHWHKLSTSNLPSLGDFYGDSESTQTAAWAFVYIRSLSMSPSIAVSFDRS